MKKIIAIILSLICLASCAAIPASAATGDVIEDVIEDYIGVTKEEDIADQMMYGIHYEMPVLTAVKLMYKPKPTITFKAPTMAKVTLDTPLSVDYEFVYWQDSETGTVYYPGDEIAVDGVVTLYAVFEEKQDNHPTFIRYIITGLEALKRLIKQFLGVTDALEENDKEFYETTTMIAQ
ncbi:MAG: hypothetical protein IKJ27_08540 [Clostridia bacterium]|nr:hypothetical protein [Clostridia bacterium]